MVRETDTSLFYTDPPTIHRGHATNMFFTAANTVEPIHPVVAYRLRHRNGGPYADNDLILQVILGLDSANSHNASGTDANGNDAGFVYPGLYQRSVRPDTNARLNVPLLEDAYIEDLDGAVIRIRYAPLNLRGITNADSTFWATFTDANIGLYREVVEEQTVQLVRPQLDRSQANTRWEGIQFPTSAGGRRGESVIRGNINWRPNPLFTDLPNVANTGTTQHTRVLPNVHFILSDDTEVATRTNLAGAAIDHLNPVAGDSLPIIVPAEVWYVTEVRPYRLPTWPDYFQYGLHGIVDDFDVIEPFRRGLQMEVLYARPLPPGHPWGPRRIVGIDHINTLNFRGALAATLSDNPFSPLATSGVADDRLRRLTSVPMFTGPDFNANSVDELMLRLAYFSDQNVTATTNPSIHGFTNQLIGVMVPVYELEGELEFRPKPNTRPDHIITVHGSLTSLPGNVLPYEVIEAIMTYYDLVFVYAKGRGEEPVVFNFNRLVWDATVTGDDATARANRAPRMMEWSPMNIRNPPGTENTEMGVTVSFPRTFTPAFNDYLFLVRGSLIPMANVGVSVPNRTVEPRRGINFLNNAGVVGLGTGSLGANRAFQALRLVAELPVEVQILPVR
jgi:hypothetical protein